MTAPSAPLYLDDIPVGHRHVTRTYTLTAEEIVTYARRYDPQPFHTDEHAASQSIFGGLAASGWLTASVSMKLLVESGIPIAGGMIGLGGEIGWPRPTRPGDTLRVESEVLEVTPSKSKPDRGTVTIRNETKNQRGEVVQVFTGKLMVPRRTSPSR
jgi:acyl dehydratase